MKGLWKAKKAPFEAMRTSRGRDSSKATGHAGHTAPKPTTLLPTALHCTAVFNLTRLKKVRRHHLSYHMYF